MLHSRRRVRHVEGVEVRFSIICGVALPIALVVIPSLEVKAILQVDRGSVRRAVVVHNHVELPRRSVHGNLVVDDFAERVVPERESKLLAERVLLRSITKNKVSLLYV